MLHAPPQHSIEAAAGLTSVYILPGDPAWDQDRITREIEEHYTEKVCGECKAAVDRCACGAERGQGDKTISRHEQHPVARYLNGETRYDLDAEFRVGNERVTVRSYLVGKATEFRLRRLSTIRVAEITGLLSQSRTNTELAMDYACRWGVAAVENLDIPWKVRNGELSDETMSALYDCGTSENGGGGISMIVDIGLAVWRISQPLTYAEKKA
jgi:hypothetical protein